MIKEEIAVSLVWTGVQRFLKLCDIVIFWTEQDIYGIIMAETVHVLARDCQDGFSGSNGGGICFMC